MKIQVPNFIQDDYNWKVFLLFWNEILLWRYFCIKNFHILQIKRSLVKHLESISGWTNKTKITWTVKLRTIFSEPSGMTHNCIDLSFQVWTWIFLFDPANVQDLSRTEWKVSFKIIREIKFFLIIKFCERNKQLILIITLVFKFYCLCTIFQI